MAAATVTAGAAALPTVPTVAAPAAAPTLPAWVVGTPEQWNWRIVRAESADKAIARWLADEGYGEGCEDPEPDGKCGMCEACMFGYAEASRAPEFDHVAKPTPGDWIRAGLGHTCCRCNDECDASSAYGIGDEAVCNFCITAGERLAIERQEASQ
ncbi:MAG: hypothetical protein C0458_04460 [Methylobacterium sp.]|nr:hypothetical protein [Methylobacterium sp.]